MKNYDSSLSEAIIRMIKESVLISLSHIQPYHMADLFIVYNFGLNFKKDFLCIYTTNRTNQK